MAGAVRFQTTPASEPRFTPLPSETSSSPAAPVSYQCEVEFSRFFNFPRHAPSSCPATLMPVPKRRLRSTGTWITAASPAALLLLSRGGAAIPVLSVSVLGNVYEEHLVSNLHYSWPQVSCVAECPVRGSRAVFMSFRDRSGQTQKFAVRFPALTAAEAFINSVKSCLRGTTDIGHVGSGSVCENSSMSEFTASNGMHHRHDVESTYEEPVVTTIPEVPALSFYNEEPASAPQPLLARNVESIFPGLPSSFTDMLASCTSDPEEEQTTPEVKTHLSSLNEGYHPDPSFADANAAQQPVLMDENVLRAQLAKYMSDASFHDLLFKLEGVINELGGDLAL